MILITIIFQMNYDYLIVGCGLFGAVFANEMKKIGKKILIVEKRNHIGGNVFTEKKNNIHKHTYGPHIFNTNSERIWEYINKISPFLDYNHNFKSFQKNTLISFPINLKTFEQIWGTKDLKEINKRIDKTKLKIENPSNFEEYLISTIGQELYFMFYYGYTKKQWNTEPKNLPLSIAKRVPIRFNEQEGYYDKKFVGVPSSGYTEIIEKMIDGVSVKTETEFEVGMGKDSNKIIYTGSLDSLFNYSNGRLPYRSLRFEDRIEKDCGIGVTYFPEEMHKHTRIINHNNLNLKKEENALKTYEYPQDFTGGSVPFYPIETKENKDLHKTYQDMAKSKFPNYIIGGRLGNYIYYNMDQIIASSLSLAEKELSV